MIKGPIYRGDMVDLARNLSARAWLLLALALICGLLVLKSDSFGVQQVAAMAGLTFCALVVLLRGFVFFSGLSDRTAEGAAERLMMLDGTPACITDDIGQIVWRNGAAEERYQGARAATMAALLGDSFANPGAVVFRLQSRAEGMGAAREDVVTRRTHLRLSVSRVSARRFLWRLEEFGERHAARGANAMGMPMLVANKGGVILFANEAMRRLLGARPKHLDRIFIDALPRNGEVVELAGATGAVQAIVTEIGGAGERRELYFLPVPERPAQPEAATDFENVPVALLRFAPNGTVLAANRAARDLVALTPGDAPAIDSMFGGLGRSVRDWFDDVLAERRPAGSEVAQLLRGEGERFMQVSLRRVVEGGHPGVLAILQDATAIKTLEAQVVQSQKMQAIGQLAGGIAHDFNNLLTAISGHCDLLLLRHVETDPNYADLVQIHQNANRAAGLVGQLLAYSRKQSLRPAQLDLEEVLSDLTHLLNRLVGEKVHLRLSHGTALGHIRADRQKLEQVIMNLVVNARDAMPGGGCIDISTEAMTLAEELHRDKAIVPPGDYAVIRVQDSGTGIAPELIEKVFEPFFTTKRVGEGTGLGLATVYGIVKQSGGFVFIDSTLGEGTRFTLYFPVHEDTDRVEVKAEPTPPLRLTKRVGEGVVLLVEDEAPVRAFASRALRLRGFTVIEAENAEVALAALEDPKLDVDIFVTDVIMPGMDGPSWVREALRSRPDVKVVFVSGYAEEIISKERETIPRAMFLSKPFSLTELTNTVQGALN